MDGFRRDLFANFINLSSCLICWNAVLGIDPLSRNTLVLFKTLLYTTINSDWLSKIKCLIVYRFGAHNFWLGWAVDLYPPLTQLKQTHTFYFKPCFSSEANRMCSAQTKAILFFHIHPGNTLFSLDPEWMKANLTCQTHSFTLLQQQCLSLEKESKALKSLRDYLRKAWYAPVSGLISKIYDLEVFLMTPMAISHEFHKHTKEGSTFDPRSSF